MVCTTVPVVTVVAISTAWAATSSAASAEWTMAAFAVSARTPAVLSGVKSQADAAVSCDGVCDLLFDVNGDFWWSEGCSDANV